MGRDEFNRLEQKLDWSSSGTKTKNGPSKTPEENIGSCGNAIDLCMDDAESAAAAKTKESYDEHNEDRGTF